jgi:hypothetical protein
VLNLLGTGSLPFAVIAYAAGTVLFGLGAYLMIGPDLRQTLQRVRGNLMLRKADEGLIS